jgi:glycosyltransferase involved in cell wall biosynthesis
MTKKLKIAVSAISKNEEAFVQRFCDSAKDADLICIADTGSTDNTVQVALECGAKVHDICISPWRFDLARNAAIALLPRDIDIVISLDLDEVLEPGWREEIERVWVEGTTRLRYKFFLVMDTDSITQFMNIPDMTSASKKSTHTPICCLCATCPTTLSRVVNICRCLSWQSRKTRDAHAMPFITPVS